MRQHWRLINQSREASMHQNAEVINIEEHRPIVKADTDKGFDKISHTITDYLCKCEISGREFRVQI